MLIYKDIKDFILLRDYFDPVVQEETSRGFFGSKSTIITSLGVSFITTTLEKARSLYDSYIKKIIEDHLLIVADFIGNTPVTWNEKKQLEHFLGVPYTKQQLKAIVRILEESALLERLFIYDEATKREYTYLHFVYSQQKIHG